MQATSQPKNHKYNCLFLPGLPGKVKHFACFDDITNTGGRIHWLQYSGTYDNQDGTPFTVQTSMDDIEHAIEELSREGLPILIVGYSYSTYLLGQMDLGRHTSILGVALFSPIRGFDKTSIDEDFNETIVSLMKSGAITSNKALWSAVIDGDEATDYSPVLQKFADYSFPVMIAYSDGDTTIKANELTKILNDFRTKTSYNSLLVFECSEGYHRLDSYYDVKIGNFFRSLEIELDLMNILDDDIFVYFWGSSLNYNYSGEGSDIDLLIFYDGYIDKYQELNNYVEAYNKTHEITFDLSINNKSDLLSKKIFRYNRGPVAIHELQYAYFPLRRADKVVNLSWDDIVHDAYNASLILSGESKKILSKCDIGTERVKKIVKYSITVFTYLQYVKGIKNLDLNHIEKYLSKADVFYANIRRSIELKTANYDGMTLDDLYQAVNAIDAIIAEQERLLGISTV